MCVRNSPGPVRRSLGLEPGCDANADPESQLPHHNPPIAYAYIKHVWHTGAHETAIQYLYVLIDELSARKEEDEQQPEDVRLLARCYHKLGLWQAAPHLSSAGTVTIVNTLLLFVLQW